MFHYTVTNWYIRTIRLNFWQGKCWQNWFVNISLPSNKLVGSWYAAVKFSINNWITILFQGWNFCWFHFSSSVKFLTSKFFKNLSVLLMEIIPVCKMIKEVLTTYVYFVNPQFFWRKCTLKQIWPNSKIFTLSYVYMWPVMCHNTNKATFVSKGAFPKIFKINYRESKKFTSFEVCLQYL